MAYEVFERTAVRVEEPTLAITPRGMIVFNAAAGRLLTAAGVKAALLLWDKNTSRFAVKATSKGDRNGFAVTFSREGSSGSLRAMTFLRYVGWTPKRREVVRATWNEKEKMLECVLPTKFVAAANPEVHHRI